MSTGIEGFICRVTWKGVVYGIEAVERTTTWNQSAELVLMICRDSRLNFTKTCRDMEGGWRFKVEVKGMKVCILD
jgi:hypothetical protein